MKRITFIALTLLIAVCSMSAQNRNNEQQRNRRNLIRSTDMEFFKTDEARNIGEQVLLWQRNTGGWPKNIDMVTPMNDSQRAKVLADKDRRDDSTTDNGATSTQMKFLARLYKATGEARYRDAFRKGVDYLLSGQYANGGWPQFWPVQRDYQIHITYNDDAMVNTMEMIRDMRDHVAPYDGDLCDPSLQKKLTTAFNKGIECILNTQIRVDENGSVISPKTKNKNAKLTIWCQQHYRDTWLPAQARAYELPSFSVQESASIVALLMSLPNPDKRVKAAVHAAMRWFDDHKLSGVKVVRNRVPGEFAFDTRLVNDPNAEPLWGRFYDLKDAMPYVCDRDGIPRKRLDQIGSERRNGYSWYGARPAMLYPAYEEWAERHDAKNKVAISLKTKGISPEAANEITLDASMFDAVVERGQSIQAAIDKAPADGTAPYKILIRKGLYNQKVIIDRPNIVLVGENRDSCIIVGAEANVPGFPSPMSGKIRGILALTDKANDCLISGLTVINNFGTTITNTTTHQFAVYGNATRTIIINSNIISDGNDALSLWGKGEDGKGGMYYHSDMYIRCPGVDFICPRGTCYATRCRFLGDTRAILWHDGRGDKENKFVITNSEFDALKPTPLGRFHHDAHFYIVNCHMTKNILDEDIDHAYRKQPELAKGKVIDPCPWGHRVYYYGCTRDGGHGEWLNNNMHTAPGSPEYHTTTALWTFNGKWDPEKKIRDMWEWVKY